MKKIIIILLLSAFTLTAQDTAVSKFLYTNHKIEIDSLNDRVYFKEKSKHWQSNFNLELKNDSTNKFDSAALYSNYYENIEKGKLYEFNYWNRGSSKYIDKVTNYIDEIKYTNSNTYSAVGYELEPYSDRRTILILVDRTLSPDLETELNQLREDLLSEGWGVRVKEVDRMVKFEFAPEARVVDNEKIYNRIKDYFIVNPDLNTEAIFLIGNTAKFYSGDFAPDDREDHIGAWPADIFFGVLEDYTDYLGVVNVSNKSKFLRNVYGPNDPYYDFNTIPSKVDLMIGSLDLSDLTSFEETEVDLLRRYLNKNHNYRTGQIPIRRRGLIDDNLPAWDNLYAPATSGWRNFNAMFGPDSIDEADYFSTLENESYLASYACGVGEPFDSLAGVGSSDDFANRRVNTVFTMLYGDYIGDWDSPNNLLRASLASKPSILNVAWVGHPHWFFHHMSVGYPIGYSTRLTMNNEIYDPVEYFPKDTNGFTDFDRRPIPNDLTEMVSTWLAWRPNIDYVPTQRRGQSSKLRSQQDK